MQMDSFDRNWRGMQESANRRIDLRKEKTAEIIAYVELIAGEYLKKGTNVYLEGRLQTSKCQDRQGNDGYTTEIIALASGSRSISSASTAGATASSRRRAK